MTSLLTPPLCPSSPPAPCCPSDVTLQLVSTETLEIMWSPVRGAQLYETTAVQPEAVIHCNDTAAVCVLSGLSCDTIYSVVVTPCCEQCGCNRTCEPQRHGTGNAELHTHTHTHTHTSLHIHTYTHMHTPTCSYRDTHTHTHTHRSSDIYNPHPSLYGCHIKQGSTSDSPPIQQQDMTHSNHSRLSLRVPVNPPPPPPPPHSSLHPSDHQPDPEQQHRHQGPPHGAQLRHHQLQRHRPGTDRQAHLLLTVHLLRAHSAALWDHL